MHDKSTFHICLKSFKVGASNAKKNTTLTYFLNPSQEKRSKFKYLQFALTDRCSIFRLRNPTCYCQDIRSYIKLPHTDMVHQCVGQRSVQEPTRNTLYKTRDKHRGEMCTEQQQHVTVMRDLYCFKMAEMQIKILDGPHYRLS